MSGLRNTLIILKIRTTAPKKMKRLRKQQKKKDFRLESFYLKPDKKTFEENIGIYQENQQPLYERKPNIGKLHSLIETFKIAD